MNKAGRIFSTLFFCLCFVLSSFSVCQAVEGKNDKKAETSKKGEASKKTGPVETIEEAINALVSPFISKIPMPVEPPEDTPLPLPLPSPSPIFNQPDVIPQPPPEPVNPLPLPPPPPEVKEPPPVFKITGIISNTARPQAIINGQVLYVGDTISGGKVSSIEKGVVKILYKSNMLNIKME